MARPAGSKTRGSKTHGSKTHGANAEGIAEPWRRAIAPSVREYPMQEYPVQEYPARVVVSFIVTRTNGSANAAISQEGR